MAGNPLYDVGTRLRAVELYDEGRGRASVAATLGIPEETVRRWLDIYRSVGIEVLTAFSQVKVDSSLCRFPTLRSGHARAPSFRYQRA